MNDLKRAFEEMGKAVSADINALRTEMREAYENVDKEFERVKASLSRVDAGLATVEQGLDETQRGLAETQRGLAETQRGLADTQRGLADTQRGLETTQDGFRLTQRSVAHQAHVLDQGLARNDETMRRHQENVGTVLYSYVDELHALKADLRGLTERVDRLERPPAA